MNIDLFKNNAYVTEYLDMMSATGLENLNPSETTREDLSRKTRSNIDHMFIRQKRIHSVEFSVIQTLISDHFSIFGTLIFRNGGSINHESVKLPNSLNGSKVKSLIQSFDWSQFLTENDVDELYLKVKNTFNSIYASSYVNHGFKLRRNNSNWMNASIMNMCKERDKLYKRWKRKPNDLTRKSAYSKIRNIVNKKVTFAKNNYYRREFLLAKNDIKKTWQILNEIIGKKVISIDQQICTNFKNIDNETIANKFADQFDQEVIKTIHVCNEIVSKSITQNTISNSIFIDHITNEEILCIMKNKNKGSGFDNIRPQDLKNNSEILTPIITKLVNLCLQEGKICKSV